MKTPIKTLLSLSVLAGGMPDGGAAQDVELRFRDPLRITGATVLRGGPASPPSLYPSVIEGNVVGMRGDTLLFETGNEPVYWIPLAEGYPIVERESVVTDRRRAIFLAAWIAGTAGAAFGWGLYEECIVSDALLELGLVKPCEGAGTAGGAALRGFAIGAGIGVVAGAVLSRYSRRRAWVRLPVEALRFETGPTGGQLTLRLPARGWGAPGPIPR